MEFYHQNAQGSQFTYDMDTQYTGLWTLFLLRLSLFRSMATHLDISSLHVALWLGDPVSLQLFIIIMESVSLLIEQFVYYGRIKCVNHSPDCRINHLVFADDLLLIAKGTKSTLNSMLEIFDIIKYWSSHKYGEIKVVYCQAKDRLYSGA